MLPSTASRLTFSASLGQPGGLQRLLSFSAWVLRRSAPHIRELKLSFAGLDEPLTAHPGGSQLRATAALIAALAACGASGSLRALRLEAALPVDPWITALRSLEHLRINWHTGASMISLDAPLHLLGRLSSLGLQSVVVSGPTRMPPSLKRLELATCGGPGLLAKVTEPRLWAHTQ